MTAGGKATTRASKPGGPTKKKAAAAAAVEPPKSKDVNKADQELLAATVAPAPGYMLAHLVAPEDRQRIGFSKNAQAFQTCALLQIVRVSKADDHSGYEGGDLVFASLEELAPVLNTLLFLVPLTRIQGQIPTSASEIPKPFGFASADVAH